MENERNLKWGGHTSGAGKFFFVPLHLFDSTSIISRFGERFLEGQYSSVSFLFAVLLLTVTSRVQPSMKSGAHAPSPMESTPLSKAGIGKRIWCLWTYVFYHFTVLPEKKTNNIIVLTNVSSDGI